MNLNASKLAIALVPVLSLGLFGYYVFTSQHNEPEPSKNISSSQNIIVGCKAYSAEESVGYLGKDVVSAGYQPLHITIENNSDRFLKFSASNMSLKTVPADIVAQSVYTNTTKRVVGWGIAGLFLPVLWIPGIVHASSSYKANEKLTQDFQTKAATDRILAPHTKIDGLLFVDIADFNTSWTLLLIDTASCETVTCAVDMTQNTHHTYSI